VGPRTGLNGFGKRKLVALAERRTSISLGRPACGLVTIIDSGLTASLCVINVISNYIIIIIIIIVVVVVVFSRLQLQDVMSVLVFLPCRLFFFTLPLEDSSHNNTSNFKESTFV